MVTIGFDIAQSLGWAVLRDGALIGYGALKVSPTKTHTENVRRIRALLESYEPIDRVGFENVEFARFVKAHASYVRVRTLLELALEGSAPEAARSGVGVKTLKEWATGNGNASKPDMVRAANAAHGLRLLHLEHPKVVAGEATKAQAKREQDMADAIHVAFFVEQVARSAHL